MSATTGIGWLDTVLVWCTVATILFGAYKVFAEMVLPKLRRIDQFLDDWNGQAERPGVPRRSGVMERLDQLEHNGGTSIKDQVARIEDKLDDHVTESAKVVAEGNAAYAKHLHEAEHRDKEIDRLKAVVTNLSEAIRDVAKPTPPDGPKAG